MGGQFAYFHKNLDKPMPEDPELWGSKDAKGQWMPYSNHVDRRGVPRGGNFLFESGAVSWRKSKVIRIGSTSDNTPHWYKIDI